MKLRDKKPVVAAVSLVALAASQATARADDIAAEIRLLKARVKQLEPLKEQLKQLEKKLAKQDRKQKETEAQVRTAGAQPGTVCKDAPCPPPPSFGKNFNNGPLVESWDHDFSFRVGGRLLLDGGVSSQPEKGFGGLANFNQARLLMEGKAFRYWDYKLEYDFAGNAPLTSPTGTSTTVAGGIRDAFLALSYFDPFTFQVGNFYEPMGLERTQAISVSRRLRTAQIGPSRVASLPPA